MISPGGRTVCNLYCMFLWERGERKEREVSPRSCSAPYSPEGIVERGGKGERKAESCAGYGNLPTVE